MMHTQNRDCTQMQPCNHTSTHRASPFQVSSFGEDLHEHNHGKESDDDEEEHDPHPPRAGLREALQSLTLFLQFAVVGVGHLGALSKFLGTSTMWRKPRFKPVVTRTSNGEEHQAKCK